MNKHVSRFALALATAVLLVVLAQLPFWLMQTRLTIQRPLFNLDLFVALLVAVRFRKAGLFLLIGAWMVEINLDAAISYHFIDVRDFVDSVRFAGLVNLSQLVSWPLLVCIALLGACAAGIHRLSARGPVLAAPLAMLLLFALSLDALNGSSHTLGIDRDRPLVGINVAGTPTLASLVKLELYRSRAASPLARLPDPATFRRASEWHSAHPDGTVFLVLVESMGLPRSAALRDWLLSRLDTPAVERRWEVRRTDETFFGPTIFGEMRVLCGLRGHYSRLTAADEASCLPAQFTREGKHAFGLHGFNLQMFDRKEWWPKLGIEPQRFDVGSAGVAMNCNNAYPGVCDGIVLDHAAALADQPRRLVYALTLDTHLPLARAAGITDPDLRRLCGAESADPTACDMVQRLGNVMDLLEHALEGMKAPPLVLVVGDHAPPFLQADTRQSFDQSRVPAFVLRPR